MSTTRSEGDPAAPADPADLPGLLQDLVDSVMADNADAILLLDEQGTIEVANPAAAALFGRPVSELVGAAFGHPIARTGTTEIEVSRGDGTQLVVEMHIGSTNWRGRPLRVATLRDVTKRVEAAAALRDFVSMASHEFRTPLSAINGFAGTILDHLDELDHEDVRRYVSIIRDQSQRLARLANDLLAMARLDAGELPVYEEDVALLAEVRRATRSVAPHMEVGLDIDPDVAVRADADHVRDMVTNYFANAIKYGREPFFVRARVDGDLVTVCVEDSGDGVPDEFVPRLFERFARARNEETREQVGTGLGLSIVRGTAELHGGRAWFEPNEPTGSRFCFSLPQATGEPPRERVP